MLSRAGSQAWSHHCPSFLLFSHHGVEDDWADFMATVNNFWRPVHEMSLEMNKIESWLDYTVIGMFKRMAKQGKLNEEIKKAVSKIQIYFQEASKPSIACNAKTTVSN